MSIEKELQMFDEEFIKPAEQSYKSAVSDQVAPYRHQLENLLEIKTYLALSHIRLMEEMCEKMEKSKKQNYNLPENVPMDVITIDTSVAHNNALEDQISHLEQKITHYKNLIK